MEITRWKLDASRSEVAVRTFAKGLLSPLAHDLELRAEAEGEAEAGDVTKARLSFLVAGLKVAGAVKGGRVDPGVLSEGDRREIERRVREEVLPGARVEAEAVLRAERVTITVRAPGGSSTVEAKARVSDAPGGGRQAEGVVTLSLRALGVPKVSGPMGVFKVGDDIEVRYRVCFVHA